MRRINSLSKKRKTSAKSYKCSNIEDIVRKGLYTNGYRYRTNVYSLPGRPDLVLPKYNAIIFINGCYWHAHDCDLFKIPDTNRGSWLKKFGETVDRDEKNIKILIEGGWRVCIVWECALKQDTSKSINLISDWLKTECDLLEIRDEGTNFLSDKYNIYKNLINIDNIQLKTSSIRERQDG